jgi:hypothetical protein
VVRVLGYRSGGPGSIPGTTRKKSSGSGTGSTQPREYNWGATWKKSSSSCLENREYGRRDPSRWPRSTLYPQKLAITSPTSGGRSVGIVRSRTQTMEFFYIKAIKMCHIVTVLREISRIVLYLKHAYLSQAASSGLQPGVCLPPGVSENILHQSEHNTGTAWTLNQLRSSHSRRLVPELRCWHVRNKHNQLINRSEPR